MTTAAEALARCLERGAWSRAECEAYVHGQSVDGVYCDGRIVLDESGRRCVSRETLDKKASAEPLPPRPVDAPSSSTSSSSAGWLVAGGVVLVLGLALWSATKKSKRR